MPERCARLQSHAAKPPPAGCAVPLLIKSARLRDTGALWRTACLRILPSHLGKRYNFNEQESLSMKKAWIASPVLLLALSLAAQTSGGSASGSSGTQSSTGTATSSGSQGSMSSPSNTTSGTNQDQNNSGAQGTNSGANPSSTTGATTGQSSTTPSSTTSGAGTSGQTGANANTSNQSGSATSSGSQAGSSAQGSKLPQTASPLPLLGLLGLGSLTVGAIRLRKR